MLVAIDLKGLCPMGCGQTLFATAAGLITCRNLQCRRPEAVTELLNLRDVIEHRVTFGEDEFQVIHPLRERFGDLIGHCPLEGHLRSLDGPPVPPGVWLAVRQPDGRWLYSPWPEG